MSSYREEKRIQGEGKNGEEGTSATNQLVTQKSHVHFSVSSFAHILLTSILSAHG